MKLWWLLDSARLAAEKQAVETISAEEEWFDLDRWTLSQGRLSAEGRIFAHERAYTVRLIYPDQFPLVPAWVEPQDETRWTSHQYGKGTLCLELRPDNWTPTASGAHVLRSAFNLLFTEDPLGKGEGKAPSDHQVGEIQLFSVFELPVFISSDCISRLLEHQSSNLRAVRWWREDVMPIYVHDEDDLKKKHRPPGICFDAMRSEIPVFVSYCTSPSEASDRATLIQSSNWPEDIANEVLAVSDAVVLFLGDEIPAAFSLMRDSNPFRRKLHILQNQDGYRTAAPQERSKKCVTIVGAGSVGAKVAESLVRSGVHLLKIIDGDILLPANLERHNLDWRDVGSRKSTALKKRLLEIQPGVEIEAITSNLNWQRSSKTHAWQMDVVAEGDVIVDATGDAATALFLGAVAEANDRTFVSIEVFEGGIGGLVATVVPKRDPPFTQGRTSFLGWCNEQNAIPPEPGPRAYEALSPEGVPIAADDAAVTTIAGHATRIILDIIDNHPPPIERAWLLIGLQKGWLFKEHGDIIRLSVGQRSEAQELRNNSEAEKFAVDLLKESVSED